MGIDSVAMSAARTLKHGAFVTWKKAGGKYRATKFELATHLFRDVERRRPWVYRAKRYRGSFLARVVDPGGPSALPEHVFVVWAGTNELTPARRRSLGLLEANLGLPLVVVTPANLDEWVVADWPLHAAYPHLALMHRADYLRAYLMHHHGGGYADIKVPLHPWRETFDEMATDPDAWVTGYSTTHASWIGKLRGRLGRDILVRYRLMFGKGGFLMRSHTPLTAEWLTQVESVLDQRLYELRASPATDVYGGPGYPMSWHDVLARVLDPLTLKHHEHVRVDERLLLDFEDYR